jgi:iron complex outermembrane recepter protein
MMKKLLLFLTLILSSAIAFAQNRTVNGTVTDSQSGEPIPGANITIKGSPTGTGTTADGKFTLSVPAGSGTLVVSFVGYITQEVELGELTSIAIKLENASTQLEEVVISVGRGSQRTITDTPLPVDNFTAADIRTTGQITFDKALQYRVPSFNTVNTPVNDATSLFDPYELRNLGPSRTLILINGKRKNLTSLVYTQTGPGRGETGADLSAIPTDAIKRVEILRDGASAQYGSDAIAGVMNIILKDNFDGSSISFNTGSTVNYGGFNYGVNYNSGAKLLGKGFVNYHLSLNKQEAAIRKDKISAEADARDLTNNSTTSLAQVKKYLDRFPDGNNKNGSPDNTSAKFLINAAVPLSENTEIYANAAYVYRKTISNANYRQPYWRLDHGLLHTPDASQPDYTVDANSYGSGAFLQEIISDKANKVYNGYIGYQPTFEGDLTDYNGTLGLRSTSDNGWKQDLSVTIGGNKMLFTVDNTVNRSLRRNSPTYFKPGGFEFDHIVGNLDFSKAVAKDVFLAFGTEFRSENWSLIPGDTSSYSGQGANSFFGYLPRNSIKANRYNLGAYADVTWDITENFLIGGTIRNEQYSDFGNAFVYKATSRYKFGETFTIRGSYSTGFRAPTLHQQYLSLSQASFQGGDIVITGLANNLSREARLARVPRLKAEKSRNITFGFGLNPIQNLSITADYYSINITDRVVYSNEISRPSDGINGVSFFLNAAETSTSGIDVVASYRNIQVAQGAKLGLNVAGNFTLKNDLVGGFNAVNIRAGIGDIFNQTQESLVTTSRPLYKLIVGGDLTVGKFAINLNNTVFGPTKFNNGDLDKDLFIEFKTKMLTDLGFTYGFNANTSLSITAQNIFNIFPEYVIKAENADGEKILNNASKVAEQVSFITFNGRYPVVTYDGSHFSQLGTTIAAQLNVKF